VWSREVGTNFKLGFACEDAWLLQRRRGLSVPRSSSLHHRYTALVWTRIAD